MRMRRWEIKNAKQELRTGRRRNGLRRGRARRSAADDQLRGRPVPDGWFELDFGTFQRAYTRLAIDPHTHAEQWLGAAWSAGGPTSIFQTMMAQPNAAAGFGGHAAQSHVWNSGLFLPSESPTDFQLYADDTGVFEMKDTTGTVQLSMPAIATSPRIVPRVNLYMDGGKATPPVAAPAAKVLARKAVPESVRGLRP